MSSGAMSISAVLAGRELSRTNFCFNWRSPYSGVPVRLSAWAAS
jgi:hypothetical protein